MYYQGHIFKGIDKIICQDQLRPVMGVAYIDKGMIVATDAHHLIKIDLSFFGIEKDDADKLEQKCIDTDTIKKLGALKATQRWFINEQGINIYKNNSDKVGLIYPLDEIDEVGNYPNYDAVIPQDEVELSSFGMNPQLMLNVEKVYSNYKLSESSNLKISLHGKNRPITMKSECTKFLGLVMPVNIDF